MLLGVNEYVLLELLIQSSINNRLNPIGFPTNRRRNYQIEQNPDKIDNFRILD